MHYVYVMGGWLPNGGALMAYEVAHLLAKRRGASLRVIRSKDETRPCENFAYPAAAELVSLNLFLDQNTSDDFLVLNPSFQVRLFSLSCRARILSYVQHFNTFPFLDPGVARFVSASRYIRDFIRDRFDISSRVIHPFVPEGLPPPIPWAEKNEKIVVSFKGLPSANRAVLDFVLAGGIDQDDLVRLKLGRRGDLLDIINRSKWFFTPVVTEGFGLIPLEAMSLGCIVIGLDGFGGRDYFTPENSRVVPLHQIRCLPHLLAGRKSIDHPASLSRAAMATAKTYSRDRFVSEWAEEIEVVLAR